MPKSVPCNVTAISVDGAKVHVVYTFDLLGMKLESTIDGERAGAKLSGKYRTRSVEDTAAVDQGAQRIEQLGQVRGMKARCRLIQQEQGLRGTDGSSE